MYNPSINSTTNTVIEKTPDPYSVVDLLYRNDNSGFGSPNTGFFVGFKQVTLNFKDPSFDPTQDELVISILLLLSGNLKTGQPVTLTALPAGVSGQRSSTFKTPSLSVSLFVTTILTDAGKLSSIPSLTLKVKESDPKNPELGIYVALPAPVTLTSPLDGLSTRE